MAFRLFISSDCAGPGQHKTAATDHKVECANCHAEFAPTATQKWKLRNGVIKSLYCSRQCKASASRRRITQSCKVCGESVSRPLSEFKKSKSGNIFCSPECGTIWSNWVGKKFRQPSKLEQQIVDELQRDFPDLTIETNSNIALGSELDIYIPELRLGIEINGPYHYLPLRNNRRKLIQTIKNDVRKRRAAEAAGIKLYILNSSVLRGRAAFSSYYPQIKQMVQRVAEAQLTADS